MKIAANHLLHMMEYAGLRGVEREEMLNRIPQSHEHLLEESATVSPEIFYDVLELIDERLGDELFGIRAGRYLTMKALGIIYRISLETATLKEGFFYLQNYLEGTFPIIKLDTDIAENSVTVDLHIENDRDNLNRIILENALTVIAREIKQMAGERTDIRIFSPRHTMNYPGSWSRESFFGLRFKPVVLQAALKDQGRLHLDILIPEYLKLIEALKNDDSFASKVKIAALNLANPELPDLKTVADSFNLTPRTLQRRLSAEDATFRRITGNLKQTISKMLLQHKRLSIADISFVLGYSEPASFIHSFTKWHGSPPQKVREKLHP